MAAVMKRLLKGGTLMPNVTTVLQNLKKNPILKNHLLFFRIG